MRLVRLNLRVKNFLKNRFGKIFPIGIGILFQHSPKELRLPAKYYKVKVVPNSPKISLVTPSYQQGEFIERTIKSIIEQRYPNLEYFIQDGNSSDDTSEVVKKYSDYISGYESIADRGQSNAINIGFGKTSGEIMGWLNSDDILMPGALTAIAAFFQKNKHVDVIYGNRLLIDESDLQIGKWVMPKHSDKVLSYADFIPQETMFWRRTIWDKSGGYVDETFNFAMDWELILRFRKAGATFKRMPRYLGGFRIHPIQKTSSSISSIGIAEMNLLRARELGYTPDGLEIHAALRSYITRHRIENFITMAKYKFK